MRSSSVHWQVLSQPMMCGMWILPWNIIHLEIWCQTFPKLSLPYINHCVLATTATVLDYSVVSSLGIMSVTGHRNEKRIQSYVNALSVSQRRKYSETLVLQRVSTGVVSQRNMTSPATSSSASTSSVAVAFSLCALEITRESDTFH